jgi:colanic acid biosynthesis glycosyl transferase WcaI
MDCVRAPLRCRLIFINRYYSPDLSATSQLLTDLVAALADEFEVHVVTSHRCYDHTSAVSPSAAGVESVQVHRSWSARFGRAQLAGRLLDYLSFYGASILTLLHLARRGDVIVALTDPPMLSVGAAAVARLRGARLVNWLQDVFPEIATALGTTHLPGWVNAVLTRLRNWSLHVAEMNVVLGEGMRRRMLSMRIPQTRLQIIENWADGGAIRPLAAIRSMLRGSLGAGVDFIVEYSGNLGRAHEFQTILGAARHLSGESGWLFLMIGGGANMTRLKSEAERADLQNLLFLPYRPREQLRDSLAAADVHLNCLLPDMEGLIVPSKFYGILAAGRPVVVIGDPQGEQARIVGEEDCGVVVECGDSHGLVQALRRMRADPVWCRNAGARARALFEQRYTLTQAVHKWRTLLGALVREVSSHTG